MKPQTSRVLAVLRQRAVTLADFERLGHIARYTLIAEPETSQSAGVTGSSGPEAQAGSVTAKPERSMAVEKPCPPARPTTPSPATPLAGASANGAQGDPATAQRSAHETADMPAPSDSPLVARAPLPAGVIPVRAHTRRIEPEPTGYGYGLFDLEPYTRQAGMEWAA